LSLEEANALARGFTPETLQGKNRFYDDQWVKYYSGTPEAENLYRATQKNSFQLKDKGSTLTAEDVEKLRRW
jgi:hypothetical protein